MIPITDLGRQHSSIKRDIGKAIKNVIKDQAFVGGRYVEQFEKSLAKYTKTKYAIGVNSGTDALLLALWACGVGPGDEVITTSFTFIATVEVIVILGAKPVLVDIDHTSFNIDPREIEKKITKKTKAIIPVHLYGQPSQMGIIMKIAKKHKLFVIEDAAQALGSFFDNKPTGSLGVAGCFSFHPNKNLAAYGDAGAIITNSKQIDEKIRLLRNHGSKVAYNNKVIGMSSRLDGLQAAILLTKLKYIDRWNKKRRKIASMFSQGIKNNLIQTPIQDQNCYHVYTNYTLRVKTGRRDKLRIYLSENGVETGVFYPIPLHLQRSLRYLRYGKIDFPESETASQQVLSLPIYPELLYREVHYIINVINKFPSP